jgi:hypothetical protein
MSGKANRAILSTLCVKCSHIFEGWDKAFLKLQRKSNFSLPHWDSFRSLEISARDCDLCYLFLNQLLDEGKARAKQVEPPKLSVMAERELYLTIHTRDEICWEFLLYVPLFNHGYAKVHISMVLVEGLGSVFLMSSCPVNSY